MMGWREDRADADIPGTMSREEDRAIFQCNGDCREGEAEVTGRIVRGECRGQYVEQEEEVVRKSVELDGNNVSLDTGATVVHWVTPC